MFLPAAFSQTDGCKATTGSDVVEWESVNLDKTKLWSKLHWETRSLYVLIGILNGIFYSLSYLRLAKRRNWSQQMWTEVKCQILTSRGSKIFLFSLSNYWNCSARPSIHSNMTLKKISSNFDHAILPAVWMILITFSCGWWRATLLTGIVKLANIRQNFHEHDAKLVVSLFGHFLLRVEHASWKQKLIAVNCFLDYRAWNYIRRWIA